MSSNVDREFRHVLLETANHALAYHTSAVTVHQENISRLRGLLQHIETIEIEVAEKELNPDTT